MPFGSESPVSIAPELPMCILELIPAIFMCSMPEPPTIISVIISIMLASLPKPSVLSQLTPALTVMTPDSLSRGISFIAPL